ncbi:MAG: WD40 repeat domain-containing protein [Phycisphaerales bacterium]
MRHIQRFVSALVLAVSATVSHAQLLYPEVEIPSFQPGSLDQFGAKIAVYDGRMLITASAMYSGNQPNAYLLDAASGDLIHTFTLDTIASGVGSISVAMTNQYIAISRPSFNESSVLIFDTASFELIRSIPIGDDDVHARNIPISLDRDRLVVGNPQADQGGFARGVVHVFDVTTGELEYDLHSEPRLNQIYFGTYVEIDSGRIVVGTGGSSVQEEDGAGIYVYDATSGSLITQYNPTTTDEERYFIIGGMDVRENLLLFHELNSYQSTSTSEIRAVDLSDPDFSNTVITPPSTNYELFWSHPQIKIYEEYIVVGGIGRFGQFDFSGRLFVYDSNNYSLISVLRNYPIDPSQSLFLPSALINKKVFVGAVENGIEGPIGDGKIYAFTLSDCPQDLNHDGALNAFDVLQFVDNHTDWNDDQDFNFFDVSLYVEQFLQGCD